VGKLDADKGQSLHPLVLVEPAQIAIEGILPARGLTKVETRTDRSSQELAQENRVTARTRGNCTLEMVANFRHEELVITKATVLGVDEGITEGLVDGINVQDDLKILPSNDRWKRTEI
jgi:hypothetical protein